jgi:tetratricopeptide (TPR) repeat protein
MDAEHRHELKSNELAEWIGRIPELVKDNLNVVIGVALILIGLLTWPLLSRMAQEKDTAQMTDVTNSIQMLEMETFGAVTQNMEDPQGRQQALSLLLVNAESLLEKADDVENLNLAAMARIKAAQAIRTELQLRRQDAGAETVDAQIAKARQAYENAYETAKDPQIKGQAHLGLGLCAEEVGQTEQAAKIYQDILADEKYQATVIPALAQNRLEAMKDKTDNVYFAPAPEQPAEAAPQDPAQTPAEGIEQMLQEQLQEGAQAPAEMPAEQNTAPQEPASEQ